METKADRVAIVPPDSLIDLDDRIFTRPSEAALMIPGRRTNGWYFFLMDQASRRSLRDVRLDYVEAMSVDYDDLGDEPTEDEE